MKKVKSRKRKNPADQSLDKSEFLDYIHRTLHNISIHLSSAKIDDLIKVTRKLEEIQDELGLIGLKTPVRKKGGWANDPHRWI